MSECNGPTWSDLWGMDPDYCGPLVEHWTRDGRTAVIDYDAQGLAQITREALHGLLADAGFAFVPREAHESARNRPESHGSGPRSDARVETADGDHDGGERAADRGTGR